MRKTLRVWWPAMNLCKRCCHSKMKFCWSQPSASAVIARKSFPCEELLNLFKNVACLFPIIELHLYTSCSISATRGTLFNFMLANPATASICEGKWVKTSSYFYPWSIIQRIWTMNTLLKSELVWHLHTAALLPHLPHSFLRVSNREDATQFHDADSESWYPLARQVRSQYH